MVYIRELSEKRGNCFSCGNLRRFSPLGRFECRFYTPQKDNAMLSDTNQPLETDCEHWIPKTKQIITMYGNELVSIENEFEKKPAPQYINITAYPLLPPMPI